MSVTSATSDLQTYIENCHKKINSNIIKNNINNNDIPHEINVENEILKLKNEFYHRIQRLNNVSIERLSNSKQNQLKHISTKAQQLSKIYSMSMPNNGHYHRNNNQKGNNVQQNMQRSKSTHMPFKYNSNSTSASSSSFSSFISDNIQQKIPSSNYCTYNMNGLPIHIRNNRNVNNDNSNNELHQKIELLVNAVEKQQALLQQILDNKILFHTKSQITQNTNMDKCVQTEKNIRGFIENVHNSQIHSGFGNESYVTVDEQQSQSYADPCSIPTKNIENRYLCERYSGSSNVIIPYSTYVKLLSDAKQNRNNDVNISALENITNCEQRNEQQERNDDKYQQTPEKQMRPFIDGRENENKYSANVNSSPVSTLCFSEV